MNHERLSSLIGQHVKVGEYIDGTVTAVREPHPLPALVGEKEWFLDPVVTIDGWQYVHPDRVKVIIDKSKEK